MEENWSGKKVLILGISKSGCAAAKFLKQKGADCWVSEFSKMNEEQRKMAAVLTEKEIKVEDGGHSEEFLEKASFAIVSPGIPPHAEIYQKLRNKNIKIISEIELAYLETQVPFVAITGTNGKTTTTALTSHILEFDGRFVAPKCGNIGMPPCEILARVQRLDYLVCELSSYQLEMSPTFSPKIGCFLNFTPDHVSWHGSLENYFNAKAKIFDGTRDTEFAIFNFLDKKVCELAKNFDEKKVYFFGAELEKNCAFEKDGVIWFKQNGEAEKIIGTNETQLVGEYNFQNIECAVLIAKILGLSNEKIKNAIKTFVPMEHRCELCGTVNGIVFYNDSKATNPESAIVAINSFLGKKVTLIAGGRDKMTSLDEFCQSVKKNVADTILIGEAAERFEKNLKSAGVGSIHFAITLEEAVDKSIALGNEVVLLSPACASFDMFKSFEHRGEVFKNYVRNKK